MNCNSWCRLLKLERVVFILVRLVLYKMRAVYISIVCFDFLFLQDVKKSTYVLDIAEIIQITVDVGAPTYSVYCAIIPTVSL